MELIKYVKLNRLKWASHKERAYRTMQEIKKQWTLFKDVELIKYVKLNRLKWASHKERAYRTIQEIKKQWALFKDVELIKYVRFNRLFPYDLPILTYSILRI